MTVDPDIAGLTTKGNAVLPNGGDGLLIDGTAHANTIGGTLRSVIPQNTFSGNKGYGLAITGHAYAQPGHAQLHRHRNPGHLGARQPGRTGCESSHPVTGHRGETAPSRLGHAKWVGNSPK